MAGAQAALPLLEATKGAFLFTGGVLGVLDNPPVADLAVAWGAQLPAAIKAAQRHLIYTLHRANSPKVSTGLVSRAAGGELTAAGMMSSCQPGFSGSSQLLHRGHHCSSEFL